jgi:hypothetical protein
MRVMIKTPALLVALVLGAGTLKAVSAGEDPYADMMRAEAHAIISAAFDNWGSARNAILNHRLEIDDQCRRAAEAIVEKVDYPNIPSAERKRDANLHLFAVVASSLMKAAVATTKRETTEHE